MEGCSYGEVQWNNIVSVLDALDSYLIFVYFQTLFKRQLQGGIVWEVLGLLEQHMGTAIQRLMKTFQGSSSGEYIGIRNLYNRIFKS